MQKKEAILDAEHEDTVRGLLICIIACTNHIMRLDMSSKNGYAQYLTSYENIMEAFCRQAIGFPKIANYQFFIFER